MICTQIFVDKKPRAGACGLRIGMAFRPDALLIVEHLKASSS
jgi:hypothetical protein